MTYGDVDPALYPDYKTLMTSDVNAFKGYLNSIVPSGGGDYYESDLKGL